MKQLILLFCTYLPLGQIIAQGPPAGGPLPAAAGRPGGAGAAGGNSASGHLYGKLVDSAGHGVADASVMVLGPVKDPVTGKRHESLLKGVSTQNNGDFSVEDLPVNTALKLSVSAIGYRVFTREITLAARDADKDLGKIPMAQASSELQQVVVTASRPAMSV
ncbi:MAG TPA: carboxypeptidase-like regulatory domain-containing protein, partial [Puia sp.]|nr:carboxypeptidase-like regulatory domain-containing protein [Puia sp.]